MTGKSKSGQNCAFVEYETPDQARSAPERDPGPKEIQGVKRWSNVSPNILGNQPENWGKIEAILRGIFFELG